MVVTFDGVNSIAGFDITLDNTYTLTADSLELSDTYIINSGINLNIPINYILSFTKSVDINITNNGIINIDGTLKITNNIINSGTINSSGKLEILNSYENKNILNNSGNLTINTLINTGTIKNAGTMLINEKLDHTANKITNMGTIDVMQNSSLNIIGKDTGSIVELINNGTITVEGTIKITKKPGKLTNNKTLKINLYGDLEIDGVLDNTGTIINTSTITVGSIGVLTNKNKITNGEKGDIVIVSGGKLDITSVNGELVNGELENNNTITIKGELNILNNSKLTNNKYIEIKDTGNLNNKSNLINSSGSTIDIKLGCNLNNYKNIENNNYIEVSGNININDDDGIITNNNNIKINKGGEINILNGTLTNNKDIVNNGKLNNKESGNLMNIEKTSTIKNSEDGKLTNTGKIVNNFKIEFYGPGSSSNAFIENLNLITIYANAELTIDDTNVFQMTGIYDIRGKLFVNTNAINTDTMIIKDNANLEFKEGATLTNNKSITHSGKKFIVYNFVNNSNIDIYGPIICKTKFENNGTINVNTISGDVNVEGILNNGSPGIINIYKEALVTVQGIGSYINNGTINIEGGTMALNNNLIKCENNKDINITNSGILNIHNNFTLKGTITINEGTVNIYNELTNGGTIIVNNGTLIADKIFTNTGTMTFDKPTSITFNNLLTNQGTLNINTYTFNVPKFLDNTITGTIDIKDIELNITTFLENKGNIVISKGAKLNIVKPETEYINSGSITVFGEIVVNPKFNNKGTLSIRIESKSLFKKLLINNGKIEIRNPKTFNIPSQLKNNGEFNMIEGEMNITTFQPNDGTIYIGAAGRLNINTTMINNGIITVEGGILMTSGSLTNNKDIFIKYNGTLIMNSNITNNFSMKLNKDSTLQMGNTESKSTVFTFTNTIYAIAYFLLSTSNIKDSYKLK